MEEESPGGAASNSIDGSTSLLVLADTCILVTVHARVCCGCEQTEENPSRRSLVASVDIQHGDAVALLQVIDGIFLSMG